MKQKLSRASVLLALCLMIYQPLTPRPQADDQGRDIEAIEVTRGRRRGKNPLPGRGGRYRAKRIAPPARTVQAGNRKSRRGQTARKGETKTAVQQFPVGPPPKGKTYVTLGVTFWRIRPATEAEHKNPKVFKERMTWDDQEHEVVSTRISDEEPVTDKDLIQISIEYLPERDGADAMPQNYASYLYVINREQFAVEGLKNARLIFPTQLTYEGDNRLLPGKTVTLPDPKRPFRIKRGVEGGHAQAYETYTIILSPVPLSSKLPRKLNEWAMKLSPDLVEAWEQDWNASPVRADLLGGVGQARTSKESGASGDTGETRSTEDTAEDLTQDDAAPQTVFRRVVQPGETMLITLRLPFKDAATKP